MALSLRVSLYGLDGVAGGDDDSTLKIGRSSARIIATCPRGMGGSGWAADADLVGGTAHIGDIVPKQLPCQGTDGETRQGAGLRHHPGVSIAGLQGRANGRITDIGRRRAWTEGSVATSRSVRRHDADHRRRRGPGQPGHRPTRTAGAARHRGHIPGVLTFQGQSYTLPLGEAPELPAELAPLISIQTGVTDTSDARGLKVTALRITLLDGTAAGTWSTSATPGPTSRTASAHVRIEASAGDDRVQAPDEPGE